MIDPATLRTIAAAKLEDAEVLFTNGRYDGARYICGYAIELVLKARICDTLDWPGYPLTAGEFQGLQSFKIHNLDMLLRLSGRANIIQRSTYIVEWSVVIAWNPEMRYHAVGTVSRAEAQDFLRFTRTLLPIL